jgi:hypothetical protein
MGISMKARDVAKNTRWNRPLARGYRSLRKADTAQAYEAAAEVFERLEEQDRPRPKASEIAEREQSSDPN